MSNGICKLLLLISRHCYLMSIILDNGLRIFLVIFCQWNFFFFSLPTIACVLNPVIFINIKANWEQFKTATKYIFFIKWIKLFNNFYNGIVLTRWFLFKIFFKLLLTIISLFLQIIYFLFSLYTLYYLIVCTIHFIFYYTHVTHIH